MCVSAKLSVKSCEYDSPVSLQVFGEALNENFIGAQNGPQGNILLVVC
jgi:hypothetical protein